MKQKNLVGRNPRREPTLFQNSQYFSESQAYLFRYLLKSSTIETDGLLKFLHLKVENI